MKLKCLLVVSLFPLLCQGSIVKGYKRLSDRVVITLSDGTLSISPLTENAVRIKFYKETEGNLPELIFTSGVVTPGFQVLDSPSILEIKTKKIIVSFDKQTGKLSYADNAGNVFLSEKEAARILTPDSIQGEPCFAVSKVLNRPLMNIFSAWDNFRMGNIT